MDYVLVSDLARYYCVITALWLIAVLARITYSRLRTCGGVRCVWKRQEGPHPFSTMGLAVLMVVAILRRFESLGEPGDKYLWLVVTGVTLSLLGVLINVSFTVKPPWRRH